MKKTIAVASVIIFLASCNYPSLKSIRTAEPIPAQTTLPAGAITSTAQRIPVVLLQDGAPDDIAAAMYLMLDARVDLMGVVVSNGESHPGRALAKWEDTIYAYMGWMDVLVAAGCDCSVDRHPNAFPNSWRDGADSFWGISLPEYNGQSNETSGADLVIDLSKQYPGELVVVVTGPQTDLALALKKDPSIIKLIKKVVMMGGAVEVPGNIRAEDGTQPNTTAEWNIWVDPTAAAEVFSSGIPLDIIPLDPVPEVELDRDFAKKVGEVNLPGATLMSSLWNKEFERQSSDAIWIYDVLAAIAVDHPEYYTWINAPISVETSPGPDQGRTVKGEGVSDAIRYTRHADEQRVLEALYNVLAPQAGTASSTEPSATSAPIAATTNSISGTWSGKISNPTRTFSTPINLSIQSGCKPGNVCGTFAVPQIPCAGDLYLQEINDGVFLFLEQDASGSDDCKSGGYEELQLQAYGTLSYHYLTAPESSGDIHGHSEETINHHPAAQSAAAGKAGHPCGRQA